MLRAAGRRPGNQTSRAMGYKYRKGERRSLLLFHRLPPRTLLFLPQMRRSRLTATLFHLCCSMQTPPVTRPAWLHSASAPQISKSNARRLGTQAGGVLDRPCSFFFLLMCRDPPPRANSTKIYLSLECTAQVLDSVQICQKLEVAQNTKLTSIDVD